MQETQEMWVPHLAQEGSLEKEVTATPVFLPELSFGQRSLVFYHLWGHKESDMA